MMSASAELTVQIERQEALDDILSRWHWWRSTYTTERGVTGGGNATSGYITSRQYDDANGGLDFALENATMRQVDFEISSIGDPWRSAICALARSLCTGAAVFHSPRIPPAERARVMREAREKLTGRLVAAGLLE